MEQLKFKGCMKNKLISIYRDKLSKEFWAHDNIEESLFLKYIFIMLKIHIFEVTRYYRKSKFKLDPEVKLMLINVYNNIMNIQKYTGDCVLSKNLSNKFAENIGNFTEKFNTDYPKQQWIRNWTEKLPGKITTANEVLRILVEIANEKFYKVLKMMELSSCFDVIYKNTIDYYRYYEDKILKLSEPQKESKYSKFVGMNLKKWKNMEGSI